MTIELVYLTVFWSIAYLLAIFHAVRFKRHAIPAFSVSLNFAWELVALVYYFEPIDIVWTILDAVIVLCLVKELIREKNKHLFDYCCCFLIYGVICVLCFNRPFPGQMTGYVFLSFFMDLLMAINFWWEYRKKHHINIITIMVALFRMLGDAVAWLIYQHITTVFILGSMIFVLNVAFLAFVSYEYFVQKRMKRSTVSIYTKTIKEEEK